MPPFLELFEWAFPFFEVGCIGWIIKRKVYSGSTHNRCTVPGRYRAVINPHYEIDLSRGGIFPLAPNLNAMFELL